MTNIKPPDLDLGTLHAQLTQRSDLLTHRFVMQDHEKVWAKADLESKKRQIELLLKGLTPSARLAVGLKTASKEALVSQQAWSSRLCPSLMLNDFQSKWSDHFNTNIGRTNRSVETLVSDGKLRAKLGLWDSAAETFANARVLQRQIELHRNAPEDRKKSVQILLLTAQAFLNAPIDSWETQRVLYALKVAKACDRGLLQASNFGADDNEVAAFCLKVSGLAVRWASHVASESDEAPPIGSSATPLKPEAIKAFPTSARLWNFAMAHLPASTLNDSTYSEILRKNYETVLAQWADSAGRYGLLPAEKPRLPNLPNIGADMLANVAPLDLNDPHLPHGVVQLVQTLQERVEKLGSLSSTNKKCNVLFDGPPGTGKSYTALQLAKLLGPSVAVFWHQAVALSKPFMGNSSQAILAAYDEAAKHPLSIVIIDEIDIIAADQDTDDGIESSSAAQENQRTAGAFWSVLDDTNGKYRNVITIATTNHKELLGKRLVGNRFPKPIHFELPAIRQIKSIINQTFTNSNYTLTDQNAEQIATLAVGLNARRIDNEVENALSKERRESVDAVESLTAEIIAIQVDCCVPDKVLPPKKPVEIDVNNKYSHSKNVVTVGVWVKDYETRRSRLLESPVIAAFKTVVLTTPCVITLHDERLSLFSPSGFSQLASVEICLHAPDGVSSEPVVFNLGDLAGLTSPTSDPKLYCTLLGLLSRQSIEDFLHDGSLLLGLRFTSKQEKKAIGNKTWANPLQQRGRSQRLKDYLEGGSALSTRIKSPRALVEHLTAQSTMSEAQYTAIEQHFLALPWAEWDHQEQAKYLEALLQQPMQQELRQTMGFATSLGTSEDFSPAISSIAESLKSPEVKVLLLQRAQFYAIRAKELIRKNNYSEAVDALALGAALRRQADKDDYATAVCNLIQTAAIAPGCETLFIHYAYKALKHPEIYQLQIRINPADYTIMLKNACHMFSTLYEQWIAEADANKNRMQDKAINSIRQAVIVWNGLFENFKHQDAAANIKFMGCRAQQKLKDLLERLGQYSDRLDRLRLELPFPYYGKADFVRPYLKPHDRIESDLKDYGRVSRAVQSFIDNAQADVSANTTVRNLVFEGPSGAGKTERALAIAKHTKLPILALKHSDIICKYMGESSRKIVDIYAGAQALADEMNSKVIVYIDEIDALTRHRSTDGDNGAVGQENERVTMELMNVLDTGATNPYDRVLTIGSTNNIQTIDSAMMGRVQVEKVYLPDEILRFNLLMKKRQIFHMTIVNKAIPDPIENMQYAESKANDLIREGLLNTTDSHQIINDLIPDRPDKTIISWIMCKLFINQSIPNEEEMINLIKTLRIILGLFNNEEISDEIISITNAVDMTNGLDARKIMNFMATANKSDKDWPTSLRRSIMLDDLSNGQVKNIIYYDKSQRFTHQLVAIDNFRELHRTVRENNTPQVIGAQLSIKKDKTALVPVVTGLTLKSEIISVNKCHGYVFSNNKKVTLSILNSHLKTLFHGEDSVSFNWSSENDIIHTDKKVYVEISIPEEGGLLNPRQPFNEDYLRWKQRYILSMMLRRWAL